MDIIIFLSFISLIVPCVLLKLNYQNDSEVKQLNKYMKLLAIGGAFYTISTALISRRKAPAAKTVKPYFKGHAPYIFAHRGGLQLRPEHTMLAFKHAQTLDVDGFEINA